MNFKFRFLVLIFINVGILMLMFLLLFNSNIDTSSRLIDLQLTDSSNRAFFFQFVGLLLGAFGANFIVGLGKNELSKREISAIADVLGEN